MTVIAWQRPTPVEAVGRHAPERSRVMADVSFEPRKVLSREEEAKASTTGAAD